MNTEKLRKEISQRFYKDDLTQEDKKHVHTQIMICKHGKNPWGYDCYYIGESSIYFTGEEKCNLDGQSTHLANRFRKNDIRCHVLLLNTDSPIAKDLGLEYSGFYLYNPSRLYPDTIIALKLIEVINPKDKGYRIVG